MSKKWYTSKTLWVNVLTVVAALIAYLLSAASDLKLDVQVVTVLTGVVGLVNVGLRFLTNQALTR